MRFFKLKKFFFMCLSISVFSIGVNSFSYASSFPDTYGGPSLRAMALGGAFTGVADDYSAAWYNPAGLALKTGHHTAIEFIYTSPKIEIKKFDGTDLTTYDSKGNVRTNPTKCSYGHGLDLPFTTLGMVIDLNAIVKMSRNIQFAMVTSIPEALNMNMVVNDMPPDQPQLIRYGDNIDRMMGTWSLGVECIDDLLYLGVGVQSILYGELKAFIPDVIAPQQEEKQKVRSNIYDPAKEQYDPIAGIMLTPSRFVNIGFAWRDEQLYNVNPSETYVSALALGFIPVPFNGTGESECFFTPEEYAFGLSYHSKKILVALEASEQLWGRYRYSHTQTLYYGKGPDFNDTVNYKLGLEWKSNKDRNIMIGYCHQPTPVPNQSGRKTNYIDMDKDIFSIGFTYGLPLTNMPTGASLKLTGMFQYQILDDLRVYKDGVDGPTWENQESYTVEGDVYTSGFSVTSSW